MCSNIQPWAWLVEREERGKTIDSRTIPHLVKRVLDFGAHWRMFFLQEQMIKSGTLSPHQTVWKSAKTMSYSNFSAKNNFIESHNLNTNPKLLCCETLYFSGRPTIWKRCCWLVKPLWIIDYFENWLDGIQLWFCEKTEE